MYMQMHVVVCIWYLLNLVKHLDTIGLRNKSHVQVTNINLAWKKHSLY